MTDTLINAGVSLIAVIVTALCTNSITKYRIGELEKKVDKHNTIIERVYKLEQRVDDFSRK